MKVKFDYPITCPKIDKNIDRFNSLIEGEVESVLDRVCPMLSTLLPTSIYNSYRDELVDSIFKSAEPIFEDVRSCNVDIRNESERIVDSLVDEIKELQSELDDKNREFDEMVKEMEQWKELFEELRLECKEK